MERFTIWPCCIFKWNPQWQGARRMSLPNTGHKLSSWVFYLNTQFTLFSINSCWINNSKLLMLERRDRDLKLMKSKRKSITLSMKVVSTMLTDMVVTMVELLQHHLLKKSLKLWKRRWQIRVNFALKKISCLWLFSVIWNPTEQFGTQKTINLVGE